MLRGEKVIIRPMEQMDLELFYNWTTQQKYLGNFLSAKMEYKDRYIEDIKNVFANKKMFFCVMEDLDNKPIGIINYYQQVDSENTLEMGMLIAEADARGKGIGKEALELFVNYIFNTKPVMRLQFKTRVDNIGMKKIGEKVGFKIEGILRGYMFDHGKTRDYYMAGITREDWSNNEERL